MPDELIDNGEFSPWRRRLHEIIFASDTPAGKAFDLGLIICILLSVLAVMLDSVRDIRLAYGHILYIAEWGFTILFTIEYFLRLISIRRPLTYAVSFFGVIDFLAIVPTYLSLLVGGTQYLLVIRILRVLRVFRVLKVLQYMGEARILLTALRASRRKITLFLFAVMSIVVVIGTLIYLVEGEENGFTSIPLSIYWAIVTLTTVGYGDVSPQTPLGRALASLIMILGYGIIAVPTGIVTVEMSNAMRAGPTHRVCATCTAEIHDSDADFCKKCGAKLPE